MSLGEVQRFYQKIRHDSDFFQLFTKTLQVVPDKYRDQAIDNFAKEQGFDFSVEEFKNFTGSFENSELNINSPEAMLSVNKLEKFFIWLSGVSPKILATCPESEQKKHAALGGTVLIPALLAIVTSSFLLLHLKL